MSNNIIGLLLTIIVGLSFFVGFFFTKMFKNKKKFINITMAIAVTVLIGIMIFDLIPEVLELFEGQKFNYLIILAFILIGFFFLFLLDKKIPHHDDHNIGNDHNHLYHIGIITTISLILHNFVEGSAIYSIALTSVKTSVLMALGVILHNIPLGIITVASIYESKSKYKYLILVLLVVSSFFGGLTLFLINTNISSFVLGSLISITLGMTIYIVFFELIKELIESKNLKDCLLGIMIGVIFIVFSLLI